MKKIVLTILVVVAIVIGGFFLLRPQQPLPPVVAINTADQPTLGNKDAPVHIVAFEDLKCGNCMRFSTTLLPQIKKRFIDTGEAKFSLINLAFIPGSMPAANAARCLYKQDNKFFFAFVDSIYQNQPPETEDWATVPYLLATVSKIPGVNQDKFSTCILNSPHNEFINNNLAQAMKIMNGSVATPTVFINGMIVKPLTMSRIEALIKAAKKQNPKP